MTTTTKRVEQGALTETTGKRVDQSALAESTSKRIDQSALLESSAERIVQSGANPADRGNPWGDTWGVFPKSLNFYGWENDGYLTQPSPSANNSNRVDQNTLSENTTKRI